MCSPKATTWQIGPEAMEEATYKMETLTPGDYEVSVRTAAR